MTITAKQAVRRFQHCFFVYVLASLSGTLYVGLTDDLRKRMTEHKAVSAALREQQIKGWRGEKKIALFAESNPQWKDLTPEIFQIIGVPPLRQAKGRDFRKRPAL